ncbi:MAG: MFS transporter [Longimicrobiales bacterium]
MPATPDTPPSDGSLRSLLQGNVGALAGTSFLNDTASEMAYPLLPLFLVGMLGAGPAFLGMVEGIAESTASLAKLGGGFLSDRARKRKSLVVWGYGVASLARPLLALATVPWHVLAVRFTDRIGKGVRSAPRDALLVDSVPPDRKGTAFGLHRAADHAGSVLGPLLAAALLLLVPDGLRLIFALTAMPGLLTVMILVKGVREVAPGVADERNAEGLPIEAPDRSVDGSGQEPGPDGSEAPGAEGRGRADLAPPTLRSLGPAFPRYLVVLLLFTLGNASDAFLLLRAQDLGVPVAALPLLWGAFHVSKMVWNVPGGMLADRIRPMNLILAGWLLYAAVYAGFAAAGTSWQVWALFGVYGLFFGLTESPEKALVAELAPSRLRGRAFGVFHFAVGLGALPASLLFGILWQWKGAPAAFGVGSGFALFAALLLPLALRVRSGGIRGNQCPESDIR